MARIDRVRRAFSIARRNRRLLYERLAARLKRLPTPVSDRQIGHVGDVVFEFDFTLGPLVATMYRGNYAPDVTLLLRRLLHPNDTVIDVGANIGYISAVALSAVGRQGTVHAFEPVDRYFQRLERLAALNPRRRLIVNRLALSDHHGQATMAVSDVGNLGWNTMVPGFMPAEHAHTVEVVETTRLDSYLSDQHITPALIKIDVEGFESPVLRGLTGHITAGHRPLILCEIAPRAYERLGDSVEGLSEWLKAHGYVVRDVLGLDPLDVQSVEGTQDVLFAPADGWASADPWVRRRLRRHGPA
jgi:FkbM family methyltransferase